MTRRSSTASSGVVSARPIRAALCLVSLNTQTHSLTPALESASSDSWTDPIPKYTKWRSDYSYKRSSLINNPGPAQAFVFLDVDEASISDGHFKIINPGEPKFGDKWISLPSDRHDRGCNLSFADGHVDHWKWNYPKNFINYFQSVANPKDEMDLRKMQEGIKQSP